VGGEGRQWAKRCWQRAEGRAGDIEQREDGNRQAVKVVVQREESKRHMAEGRGIK
jgi:hypothetical protein